MKQYKSAQEANQDRISKWGMGYYKWEEWERLYLHGLMIIDPEDGVNGLMVADASGLILGPISDFMNPITGNCIL